MSLPPGARLGSYEVAAAIGAGGMGEVFRARDTTLNRDVAIKVLPAALASDPERLARFKREAQVLASLNHPNIAHVYGFEGAAVADGSTVHFLAMELVEGEDIAERLKRGAIPVDEAIAIARRIAEGLEEAHEHGIIHRDLKPANVKVTPDGKVKILDFGLAKAMEGDPTSSAVNSQLSHSPTMSRHMTEAGMIMGTAAYMSPEQARGKPVDKRTDIWAFGVVLFEMLTGQRLFAGETVSDVLAAVLKTEPNWDRLPGAAPSGVLRLLRRCLERDVARRLHDIADARIELDDAGNESPTPAGQPKGLPASRRLMGAAGLLALIAAAFAGGRLFRTVPSPADTQVAFALRPSPAGPGIVWDLTLSRDGRRLIFRTSADPQVQLREMDRLENRAIPGTAGAEKPFLSPDGRWLAFFADGKLKKVDLEGGDPIPICDAGPGGPGGAWGLDGSIYFTPTYTTGLFKVDANGGPRVQLTTTDRKQGEAGHLWPSPLPGGKALVFTIFGGSGMNGSRIAALDLRSNRFEVLFEGAAARYVASGHLVFYRRGAHHAVPFDAATLKVTGPERAVLPDVAPPSPTGGALNLAFSDTGRLAYVPGPAPQEFQASRLAWLSRDGTRTPLAIEGVHGSALRISPDGQRAIAIRYIQGDVQLWLYDLTRGTEEALSRGGVQIGPGWHPDGRHVGYTTLTRGNYDVWWGAFDGSRPPEPLIEGEHDEEFLQWTPDGRAVLFQAYAESTGRDIMLHRFDAPQGEHRALVATPLSDTDAMLSRDGKWLAYVSGDALYVSPFPAMTARTLVSPRAGSPRWSASELFFLHEDQLMAAHFEDRGAALVVAAPRPLLTAPQVAPGQVVFDATADGKRFLFLVPKKDPPTGDEIHVRLDGFEQLNPLAGMTR